MNYRLEPQQQFEDLREVSENVADFLGRELFKEIYGSETDYTLNDILADCYLILLQELKDLGIQFDIPEEDLLNDWYTAKRIYCARKIADGVYLRTLFMERDIQERADMWVQSEENPTSLFSELCDFILERYPDRFEIKHLEQFIDQMHSTELFKDHMSAILKNIKTDEDLMLPDVSKAMRYIQKVGLGRQYFHAAINSIVQGLHLEGKINQQYIDRMIRDYDMDKISADNLSIYALIDNNDTIPALDAYKKFMLDLHHKRSRHHIEYWLDHLGEEITTEDCIMMVAHFFEPGATTLDMKQDLRELIVKAGSILTSEQIALMKSCLEYLPTPESVTDESTDPVMKWIVEGVR